jgi:hypothetical protein
MFGGVITKVKSFVDEWIVQPVKKMFSYIGTKFDDSVAWIKEKFNEWVLDPIKNAISFIGDKFTEFMNSPFVSGIIDTFKTVFGSIETYVITPIKNVLSGIWKFIKGIGETFGFLFSDRFSLIDALNPFSDKSKSFGGQMEGFKSEQKLFDAAASDKDVKTSIQGTKEYNQALRETKGGAEEVLRLAIEKLVDAQQKSGNNTQINNIMSGYHPINVMSKGTAGGDFR